MQIPILSGDRFYVYEHLRKDNGLPFYVGKGQGKRARVASPHHRNEYWQRVAANQGGFDVRFVAQCLSEELAFLVECERIDQLRRMRVKLCNLTDGGDGTSGWVKTAEWRAKVGAKHRGKCVPPEVRAKISAAVIACGYRPDAEARGKISAAHIGHRRNVGRVQPDSERKKRALSLLGNKSRTGQRRSAEERAKQSEAMKGRAQKVLTCPHCNKSGGNAMRRFHFDLCKGKP